MAKTKRQEYGNESISMLKDEERVRKRPAVIFGSDDLEGCKHAVFEILSNAIDEAREGHGDTIVVTRYEDLSVEVEDFGRDLGEQYDALELQGGYDHNWEVFCNPCAIVSDPESGRTMSVYTDCVGLQFYCGNFLEGDMGKGGVSYCYRGGIALETQFYPNSVNNPQWVQPFTKAGERFHTVTEYRFS